jgi:hypothetical protein
MDWELLMRIGLRYPIVFAHRDMGAIREYATAKSFAGGAKRARELTKILRRHTGKRFPPGMFVYGVPTYERLINAEIGRLMRGPLEPVGSRAQRVVTRIAHRFVGSIVRGAQGWYTDLWAGPRAEFTFPAARGRVLALDVTLPPWSPLARQSLELSSGGHVFAHEAFGKGEFTIPVMPPREAWEKPFTIVLRASSYFRPPRAREGPRDRRKLSYLLRSFDYET